MFSSVMLATLLLSSPFDVQLEIAGQNRAEIQQALSEIPEGQRAGMEWLITHMPKSDLQTLTSEFLLNNCNLAYEAWRNAPWVDEISEAMFFDTILPYANVNERRDDWRGDFRQRFADTIAQAKTPSQATVLLNQQLFKIVGVKYSNDRPKADQSPYESIEAGMASCTGLSILLIDACRSVGVPARFVGTPLWYNESGNHSWVEIWDDGWHFTGAAEPTGDKLDAAWFTGSASKATKGDPQHAIYAVTWNETPLHYPLVWLPENKEYGALDVTDRYDRGISLRDNFVPIHIVAFGRAGARVSMPVRVIDANNKIVLQQWSNDETHDANDYLTANLVYGGEYTVIAGSYVETINVSEETIIEFHPHSLTEQETKVMANDLWDIAVDACNRTETEDMKARVIKYEGMSMPFWYTVYGDAPMGKRSLWISMHGGGGAPTEVNDAQWENQKHLYELEEGVYVAPRAPTDSWNLWHQSHIDPMFEKLILYMIIFEGVDPNRVYILGYSAGGDGVYQLAARMADRLAAAGMMAGHPNETKPDGLRNIGFALHVGGDDGAYSRNTVGANWKQQLDALQAADPDGYAHQAVIHEGKGHWMDHEEDVALPWMAQFTRNPYPKKVVWLQDDVLHDRFYWLGVKTPQQGTEIVASLEGQTLTIQEVVGDPIITVYLNDTMVNLDEPVIIKYRDLLVISTTLRRDGRTLSSTFRDPTDYYTAQYTFSIPQY